MQAEVKILLEGFTNADSVAETGEERTQPTITLIKDEGHTIIVDPGILESQQILIDALQKEGLSVGDVDIVCITHSHLDHYRNIGMFPNAKTLEYNGLWHKNTIESWAEDFSENIQILHTPGHDYSSITLFVTTKEGVVAICGDVFWKENYPRDPQDDAYASNVGKLKESRGMVVRMADWIIPGHGGMYKNDKSVFFSLIKKIVIGKGEKVTVKCKSCQRGMQQKEKCKCRPYLCYRCCLCGLDCDNCSCSHEKK